jgi:tRNA (guanine-N7-)-methyltransferase
MYGFQILEDNNDVYANRDIPAELTIQTHYEKLDIAGSKRIHFLSLQLPLQPLPMLDEQLYETVRRDEEGNN